MTKKLQEIPLGLLLDLFVELNERRAELRDRTDILDIQERQELEDIEGIMRGLKSYVRRRQTQMALREAV